MIAKWLPLLLFSHSLFAFTINRHEGKLYLTTSHCDQAVTLVNSLVIWTTILGESTQYCSSKPVETDQGCTYNITNCIPKIVNNYHNHYPSYNGPNCWNSALVSAKILPALRYTSPEEMSFYMNSPLCRRLDYREPEQAGDIGAIRDVTAKGTLEVHGFIYLTPTLVYSKNEYFSTVPYLLMPLEDMYDVFTVPQQDECRHNSLASHHQCQRIVEFYRCQSWNSYTQLHPINNSATLQMLQAISRFSKYLEKTNMYQTEFDDQRIISFVQKVERFVTNLSNIESSQLSTDLFYLKSIYWRIFALSEQLGMLFYIRENQRLLDLSIQLHRYLRTLEQ